MQRTKENGTRNKQDLRLQVINITQCHLRSSKHLTNDRDFDQRRKIRMKVGILCNVGFVENSIIGEIVHSIRVVDHGSIVIRKHRQWETLGILFLGYM